MLETLPGKFCTNMHIPFQHFSLQLQLFTTAYYIIFICFKNSLAISIPDSAYRNDLKHTAKFKILHGSFHPYIAGQKCTHYKQSPARPKWKPHLSVACFIQFLVGIIHRLPICVSVQSPVLYLIIDTTCHYYSVCLLNDKSLCVHCCKQQQIYLLVQDQLQNIEDPQQSLFKV